jgi:DNA-binding NarL/FixJ family response regulator
MIRVLLADDHGLVRAGPAHLLAASDDLSLKDSENKLIARRLDVAEKTVKNNVTRILQVLGVTDRTQAALWVREQTP